MTPKLTSTSKYVQVIKRKFENGHISETGTENSAWNRKGVQGTQIGQFSNAFK